MTQLNASTALSFNQFAIDKQIQRAIREAGFNEPRPIQVQAIPPALEGNDILGLAQTGTGKTAAFAIPLLQQLYGEKKRQFRGLVLAPTRELARQIELEMMMLAKYTGLKVVSIYGGMPIRKQINDLRKLKPEIIVACPGRLLDLYRQKVIHFDEVECVVLDEADYMLDMGFLPDIEQILSLLPSDYQAMLFSATMPKEIRTLANNVLKEPTVIELSHSKPVDTIAQQMVVVADRRKLELLKKLIAQGDIESAIIFTRTKKRAKNIADALRDENYQATALQGDMSQAQRDRAMKGFRQGKFNLLVATDVAARGIDVANVSHVINYDLPETIEAYTHRIGRTGRSQQVGTSLSFVAPQERHRIRSIERQTKITITEQVIAGFERAQGAEGDSDGERQEHRRKPKFGDKNRRPGARRDGDREHKKRSGNSFRHEKKSQAGNPSTRKNSEKRQQTSQRDGEKFSDNKEPKFKMGNKRYVRN